MEIKNYELTIDDINYDGVTALSLVEYPAIETEFMVFNVANNYVFAKIDVEKRIITGPALFSNKYIYRVNQFTGEEYNVYFSDDTVRKIAENYLIQNKNSNVTLEHSVNVNDISLIESWICNNPEMDKSKDLGYNFPSDTIIWMVSMKVNNDDVWNNYIKEGKVKGFSLEGYFTTKFDKYSKEEPKQTEDEKLLEEIKKILDEFDNEEK